VYIPYVVVGWVRRVATWHYVYGMTYKLYQVIGTTTTLHRTTNAANDLVKLTVNDKHRLITLDIKDLYVIIPLEETIDITRTQLLKYNNTQTTNQIITLLEGILRQNYFDFQGQIYQPDKGVAMGSPISSTMAKLFIQHLEDSHIKHLLDSKGVTFYSRYVIDILLPMTPHTPNPMQYYNTSAQYTTTYKSTQPQKM
jgi:hypothetical protein